MPVDPQPISRYVDPSWYYENLSGTFVGPPRPPELVGYITPLESRTVTGDPATGGSINDSDFLSVRNTTDLIGLTQTQKLIKDRGLASKKADQSRIEFLRQNLPQEYTYTTNIESLLDCFVLKLKSPKAKSNPGISRENRDQELIFTTIDTVTSALKESGVTDTAQNLASTIGDFASKFTQDKDSLIGKAIKGIAGGAEAVAGFAKDLVTPGGLSGISKQKFDYLDTSVYSQGNPDDRYTVIYLPMPKGQLVDSHSHSINGVGMNPMLPLMGLAAGIIDAIVPGSGTGGGRGMGSRGFGLSSSVGEYASNFAQLNGRKSINPAMETLYQAPVPRQWQFTFVYAPTNKDDMERFLAIVKLLKEHSYPTVDAKAVLFNFPGTAEFHFRINGREKEYIGPGSKLPNSLYPCFIKSVQIDYINDAPFYSHYKDGNPTSLQLTLEIVESKLLTRETLNPGLEGMYNNNLPVMTTGSSNNMQRTLDDVAPLDRTFG